MPPLGLEEGQQSSGETALPVNHCAPPGALDLNPEQLAAMLRDLDRSELEQLLLTLLSKAESTMSGIGGRSSSSLPGISTRYLSFFWRGQLVLSSRAG